MRDKIPVEYRSVSICPACEHGDHEHAHITRDLFRCDCACHTTIKMHFRFDLKEMIRFEVKRARAAR